MPNSVATGHWLPSPLVCLLASGLVCWLRLARLLHPIHYGVGGFGPGAASEPLDATLVLDVNLVNLFYISG